MESARNCPQRLPPIAIRPRPRPSWSAVGNWRSTPFKGDARISHGCWPKYAIPRPCCIAAGRSSPATNWPWRLSAHGAARFMVGNRPSGFLGVGTGGNHRRQRTGPRHRRGGPPRCARGGRPHNRRLRLGLPQVYPPDTRSWPPKSRKRGPSSANRPSTRNRSRPFPAAEPHHQRLVAGRGDHRGDPHERAVAHGPPRDGAGSRSLRPARAASTA